MNKILYNTKYLQLKSTLSKNGDEWIYGHRPNAIDVVVILPETEDEVLFIIEERPPLQAENIAEFSIGFPAGLVGDEDENEDISSALQKELLEEAGLVAESIRIVAKKVASSPGCVSETITLAIAKINNKTIVSEPVDDGGIIVDRIWVKKNNIRKWLKEREQEGYAITGQTLAALYFLEEG